MSSLFCKKFHLNLLSALSYENYVRKETDFKSDKFPLDSTIRLRNIHMFKRTKSFLNAALASKMSQIKKRRHFIILLWGIYYNRDINFSFDPF